MNNSDDPYKDIPLGKIKRVYVCSPVKGDQDDPMIIKDNLARAVLYSKYVYDKGYFPMCPHVYIENATGLNEADNPADRKGAIRLGLEMLLLSDELWVFGCKEGEESSGMKKEIEEAKKRNMPIYIICKNERSKKN